MNLQQPVLDMLNGYWLFHPMAIVYGAMAAIGMALFAGSSGLFTGRIKLRRRGQVSLADEQARINGDPASTMPFWRRALLPLVETLLAHAPEQERAWVDRAYDLLDKKGDATDFYLRQSIHALAGFVSGLVIALALARAGSLVWLIVLPVTLALVLYLAPKQELHSALKKRREQMLFEVPFVLDTLSVNILARNNLIQGLEATVSRPEGGYLTRELLQVVEDNAKNGRLQEALKRMAARNNDAPFVSRIALRLAMAEDTGAGVVKALQTTGDRATEMVENMIQSRGEENNMVMIAPCMIALVGVIAAVLAPSMGNLLSFIK